MFLSNIKSEQNKMWKTNSHSCKLNDGSIEYYDQCCSLDRTPLNESNYDYIGTGVIYEINGFLQGLESGLNEQKQYKFYKLKQSYNKEYFL